MVRSCKQCQPVKSEGSIRSRDERLKSIPIRDLFHRIVLDTTGPLPETKAGNKYILMAIDHYSKWCEAKAVADHEAKTVARFLEDDLICKADNCLNALTDEIDDSTTVEDMAAGFLEKVRLIASIHEKVLFNVEQTQKKQKSTYANRAGKHLFEGLVAGISRVKMRKLGKRRALSASWEGPYQFVGHTDRKGNFNFEEGCRMCIVQDADGRQWERPRRDLQIFYAPLD